MPLSTTDHPRAVWRCCLVSAFRTALACTIVGCITFFGPSSLRRQIAFPAFSYVTVILIVTDATLGDTLHGCWLALYATVQSVAPAMLSLWLIGPTRFTAATISLAVAAAAFTVTLPEGTHLVAKRIALGQIVIVYVIGYIQGEQTEAVMHSLHVAASTAIGVFACVVALLSPYPGLACREVKHSCKLFAETSSERLKLYTNAGFSQDKVLTLAYISQAKQLATAGVKYVQSVRRYQESMKWERLPFMLFKPHYSTNPGERLEEMEIPLRGMEMALTANTHSLPLRTVVDEESFKEALLQLQNHVSLTLKNLNNFRHRDLLTVPESNSKNVIGFLQTLQTIPTNYQDLPPLFFLFCVELLHRKLTTEPADFFLVNDQVISSSSKEIGFLKNIWKNCGINLSTIRLMSAFKCSLSLGLAVLFGLIYSKENGYWSGLPVAISLASAREATFKVANIKAQGTVLGTVYGVLGCFIFERFLPVRFISLLPWFIVTSFLRRSRMYGQAGGLSAVIGAVLILGRKNFGPPSEFAIARIVETFIGLSCSIVVELLFQPKRASSLAKVQLSKIFGTLHACICSISVGEYNKANLLENQRKLRLEVGELRRFIGEAEVEPNFWFLPFHSVCYGKLSGSLSRLVDLLLFSAHALELLEHESHKFGASWKENVKSLDGDLEAYRDAIGSLVKCFQDVTIIRSASCLDKEHETRNVSSDVELGKSTNSNIHGVSDSEKDEVENTINSYLQHSKEAVDKLHALGDEELAKSRTILNLSTVGFCLSTVIKETREIEKGIFELFQWENPSNTMNLFEISCKNRAIHG
ncbi:hypothetical protein K2173_015710 [Erythroxylum novogranatense]|uniref:Rhodanese domain-containing protein n=1 Tax=Erythroxylum novogranatense TaxID=1862640 RepID=A0AAV8SE87_9ROSI|nr:hypothetical protein K2173_015710 [Erythroxylum novogranatense]